MSDEIERARYLLETVGRFIRQNPITEYEIYYDEAMCDGSCLADDCKLAADALRRHTP